MGQLAKINTQKGWKLIGGRRDVLGLDAGWRRRLGVDLASKGIKLTQPSVDISRHRDYVANTISGKATPDLDTLMTICRTAGIDPCSVIMVSATAADTPEVVTMPDLENRLADALNSINSAQLPWKPGRLD